MPLVFFSSFMEDCKKKIGFNFLLLIWGQGMPGETTGVIFSIIFY